MIAVRRRERSSSKITTVTQSYASYGKVSRTGSKKPYDSRSNRSARPRSLPGRVKSVGGKHGRVAALISVTTRPAVQDGRHRVLDVVRTMADNNTRKRGLQATASSSRGRGITLPEGLRYQSLPQQLQTATNNATSDSSRTTTPDTRNRTKRKTPRHSETRRSVETVAHHTLSDTVDSDITSISARPAAEGSSHSDHEETVDADPETEELAKLRCPSERTEVIAERETRRRQRRCADYPGFAFGSSIFGSDTIMKFNIIRNELQNIKNSQLKRVSTHGFPIQMILNVTDHLISLEVLIHSVKLCPLLIKWKWDGVLVSCRNFRHVTGRGGALFSFMMSHPFEGCTHI